MKSVVLFAVVFLHTQLFAQTFSKEITCHNTVQNKFNEADLKNLQAGDFWKQKININLEKRLLVIDRQQLINGFENKPGVQDWIGEHGGKFLDAAVNTYLVTHNAQLKNKIDWVAEKLIAAQEPDGYLGTYLPLKQWTSWDVWVHNYDLIGLLSYHKLNRNNSVLSACKKIAGLISATFGTQKNQHDIEDAGEHGGMAATCILDPFCDLYNITGDVKYLNFCNYIVSAIEAKNGPHIISFSNNKKPVNEIADGKAYEMMLNLIGILKMYKITGNTILLNAVNNAWNDIVKNRLYLSGTASSFENFTADNQLKAETGDNMGEGCVTVTWMQLNWELFKLTSDDKYMEQIDRSIYNALLAAENPQNGCVSYYTALDGLKPYACDISCCTSSVPRGIAMVPYFFYGKNSNVPCILEMASFSVNDTVQFDQKKFAVNITSLSQIPLNGETKIIIRLKKNERFPLQIRVPEWCSNFTVTDKKNVWHSSPGTFLTINKEWQTLNELQITCELPVKIIPGDNIYQQSFALQRGPQILAVDSNFNPGASRSLKINNAPALSDVKNILPHNWIGSQAYRLQNDPGLVFIPYADAGQLHSAVQVWIRNDNQQ